MAVLSATSSWHVVITGTIYYWDNENPNGSRTGLSWEAAYRDGEGTVGAGTVSLFKATDTPYRMVLNTAGMQNETVYCDMTGVGFERSAKQADFRASDVFTFTPLGGNIYSTNAPDVLTGARSGFFGMDYPGHYLMADTLNFEGARGVWHVDGETIQPLTRVLSYGNLSHGKWYWNAGTLYICWVGAFDSQKFEVVQRAKAIELWTDTLPDDAYRPGVYGIRSRFGLFGHHNSACRGWRAVASEFAWNALDGLVVIAENVTAKSHQIYTQAYLCNIHNNGRHGVTNFSNGPGANGRGYVGWFELCSNFNYIHDNVDAGIFIHRTWRVTADPNLPSVDYPIRIGNNTVTRNGRGIVLTDENMELTINTFGYDLMVPAEWEAMSYAQKVAYFNSLNAGYDTLYVELRNNNVFDNEVNTQLVTGTWPGTNFVIDSDYNNIYPNPAAWSEGANSLSVDPIISEGAVISFSSPLHGAGEAPFAYPKNTEANLYYFTEDAAPYQWDVIGASANIGAGGDGPGILRATSSWRMPSFTIESSVSDATAYLSSPVVAIGTGVAGADAQVLYESSSEGGVIFGQWATWSLVMPPILRFSDTATCKLQSIETIRGEA